MWGSSSACWTWGLKVWWWGVVGWCVWLWGFRGLGRLGCRCSRRCPFVIGPWSGCWRILRNTVRDRSWTWLTWCFRWWIRLPKRPDYIFLITWSSACHWPQPQQCSRSWSYDGWIFSKNSSFILIACYKEFVSYFVSLNFNWFIIGFKCLLYLLRAN